MSVTPTIDKPCIKKCSLDEYEVCMGCFRTFSDMKVWRQATRDEKSQMLLEAQKRKKEYQKN